MEKYTTLRAERGEKFCMRYPPMTHMVPYMMPNTVMLT